VAVRKHLPRAPFWIAALEHWSKGVLEKNHFVLLHHSNTPSLHCSIQFPEPKPQQTGTRLLIGQGEVATTSGSTNLANRSIRALDYWSVVFTQLGFFHQSISPSLHFFLPGRLTSRTSPFEGDCGGANPFPAAILQINGHKGGEMIRSSLPSVGHLQYFLLPIG
jgi:hypothetical protein